MSHQGLKDKVLAEVHQCVLLEGPLTLLTMVLNRVEHGLSFTSHVTNIVRPQIVRVRQLIGKSTVSSLLHSLDDREGIVGEDNLVELLPHRHPVDNETWGERPESFRVRARANCRPSQKYGAPRTHLVIMRDVQTPDYPSWGVNCCQGRNKVRAIDIAEQGILVASAKLTVRTYVR